MTVTLTPTGTNLGIGVYTAIFQVTNLTGLSVQTVTGTVQVSSSLVLNGGFETGDLTDWSLSGTAGDTFVDNGSIATAIAPRSGTYFAVFAQPGSLGTLSQTIPTSAGQKYLLSIWLNSPNVTHSTPNEFKVTWNGGSLWDHVNISKVGWTNLSFVVSATGSSTVLQLGGRNDRYALGLDDVSLIPGNAPSFTTQPTNQAVYAGSNVVFSAAVTGSTNLVYQWLENGTNIFNGAGISGAGSNVLTLSGVTANSGTNYALEVTNMFRGGHEQRGHVDGGGAGGDHRLHGDQPHAGMRRERGLQRVRGGAPRRCRCSGAWIACRF